MGACSRTLSESDVAQLQAAPTVSEKYRNLTLSYYLRLILGNAHNAVSHRGKMLNYDVVQFSRS